MSSGPVNPFVDFGGNANDSNENNAASIQPVADGEGVNATVLTRPTENMRKRSEALRSRLTDSFYIENADRVLVIAGPGKVTWPGSTTASASGIPVLSDVLWILPMLTPGFAQSAPVPPVASAFGVLHLKRASDNMNSILVTSQRRSYAAGDQINITVTAGTVYSCTLDVEDTGTLRRTIKIVATSSTTLGTVIASLNGLTPPAPDNTQLVTAALEGGALAGDLILTSQARQFVSGNYDGEGHTITPANLAVFFSSNPSQALAEGDTLCVAYADLYDTATNGGRRQSIPENSNMSIPAASFFNSRVHPELLYNALPICKVINGRLVFGTGVEVASGAVSVDLGATTAAMVAYGGGDNWADGTANPATTVEAQLDKIIDDLATGAGVAKLHAPAIGTDLSAGTLAAQLTALATTWLKMDRANTVSAAQTFSALITATLGVTVGANAHVTLSGSGRYKRGTMAKKIPAAAGVVDKDSSTTASNFSNAGTFFAQAQNDILVLPIHLVEGERLTAVSGFVLGHTTLQWEMRVWKIVGHTATQLGTTQTSAAAGTEQTLTVSGLAETAVAADRTDYTVAFSVASGTYSSSGIPGVVEYAEASTDVP